MKNQPKPVNTHFNLGKDFVDVATKAQFPNHILRFRNNRSAQIIGLDNLSDEEWIDYFGKFNRYPGIQILMKKYLLLKIQFLFMKQHY